MSSKAKSRDSSPSRSKSKKDKEKKKRPAFQHPVFKTKAKAKKVFTQLDVTKRTRLTKTEFIDGLKQMFQAEVRHYSVWSHSQTIRECFDSTI